MAIGVDVGVGVAAAVGEVLGEAVGVGRADVDFDGVGLGVRTCEGTFSPAAPRSANDAKPVP
ncbi:hypothetical protein ABN028_21620 [Actinopolymorpha sp. B17G11]|uniref:hypothetical protein n=1 Tax=Actinopolymorpha sp. B17G11 TaxID=3160861 RepID=UPI0032E3D9D2